VKKRKREREREREDGSDGPTDDRFMNMHDFSGRCRRALLPICHTPWHYPILLIKQCYARAYTPVDSSFSSYFFSLCCYTMQLCSFVNCAAPYSPPLPCRLLFSRCIASSSPALQRDVTLLWLYIWVSLVHGIAGAWRRRRKGLLQKGRGENAPTEEIHSTSVYLISWARTCRNTYAERVYFVRTLTSIERHEKYEDMFK